MGWLESLTPGLGGGTGGATTGRNDHNVGAGAVDAVGEDAVWPDTGFTQSRRPYTAIHPSRGDSGVKHLMTWRILSQDEARARRGPGEGRSRETHEARAEDEADSTSGPAESFRPSPPQWRSAVMTPPTLWMESRKPMVSAPDYAAPPAFRPSPVCRLFCA